MNAAMKLQLTFDDAYKILEKKNEIKHLSHIYFCAPIKLTKEEPYKKRDHYLVFDTPPYGYCTSIHFDCVRQMKKVNDHTLLVSQYYNSLGRTLYLVINSSAPAHINNIVNIINTEKEKYFEGNAA